jgi:hypothetical protein
MQTQASSSVTLVCSIALQACLERDCQDRTDYYCAAADVKYKHELCVQLLLLLLTSGHYALVSWPLHASCYAHIMCVSNYTLRIFGYTALQAPVVPSLRIKLV